MNVIYAIYECDNWKAYTSMSVNSPIIMTVSFNKFKEALINEVNSLYKSTELENIKEKIEQCFKEDSYSSTVLCHNLNEFIKNRFITCFIDL